MAMQVVGTDGGILIDTICKKRDGDRLKYFGGETITNPKESVLMFCKYDKASRKITGMLEEVNDKGLNSNPFRVIDLGTREVATLVGTPGVPGFVEPSKSVFFAFSIVTWLASVSLASVRRMEASRAIG